MWLLCHTWEWVACALQESDHHIAFPKPSLEHKLQPTPSATSLTSSGQSNDSEITIRSIYRGSQTKTFHCSPIFLVPTGLLKSLFIWVYFVPTKDTPLQLSFTHITRRWNTPLLFVHIQLLKDRLILRCCCRRGSYPTEGRKKGCCSGPSTALPRSSPHTQERTFQLSKTLYNQFSWACSRSSHHIATSLLKAWGTLPCTSSQEVNAPSSHKITSFRLLTESCWLAENGPNAGRQSENASALPKCSMEHGCANMSQEPAAARSPVHGIWLLCTAETLPLSQDVPSSPWKRLH